MLLAVTGIGLLISLQCLTRGKEILIEQCGLLAQYFYYEDRILVAKNTKFQFNYSRRKSVSHTSVYVFFCIVIIVHLDGNVCLE